MSILDLFTGKKKSSPKPKITIYETSINTQTRKTNTEKYSLEEYYRHLENLVKDAGASSPPAHERPCDVFLCHNSEDKQTVMTIGKKLRLRGIDPWIDSEKIVAGSTYDDIIQKAVKESRSAVIFFGSAEFGKYQRYEMRAFLSAAMAGNLRAIPVLLPDCSDLPEDEVFLRQHHYVKFNSADDDRALEALVRAINA